MISKKKFSLRNLAGKPVSHYFVDAETLPSRVSQSPKDQAVHHIIVLDVSGSMWGDIEEMKTAVEKVLTAQEFDNPFHRVSLISYASNGDCVTHFQKTIVADALRPNSKEVHQIRALHTRGMTGISQALLAADKLVDDHEVTAISLHSDGYANDPSPYAEHQRIDTAVRQLKARPRLFANTIAHRESVDFPLLSSIANTLSGRCVRAERAKQIYDALVEGQTLLGGRLEPMIEVPLGSGWSFGVFVSCAEKKVVGGAMPFSVLGIAEASDKTVYRYVEVTKAEMDASGRTASDENRLIGAMLAFARGQLSVGNLNRAKQAMISTRLLALRPHLRALVSSDLAAMTEAIEEPLFRSDLHIRLHEFADSYGLGAESKTSVLEVLGALEEHRHSVQVRRETLVSGYQRRGLVRVPGARDDHGNLIPPPYEVQPRFKHEYHQLGEIALNRTTATANLQLVDDVELVDAKTKSVIREVANVPLKLSSYRNYTVVGDGRINVEKLELRTSDKRCATALRNLGLAVPYEGGAAFEIDFGKLPLVGLDQELGSINVDDVEMLLELTVLGKILSGITTGTSPAYTGEQIVELQKHHLTPAMYFSPPTTTPYVDLKDAIDAGEVDGRVSFQIWVGKSTVLSPKELYSGNEYLKRRFTALNSTDELLEEPKLAQYWALDTWAEKKLSSRVKLNDVDALSFPIYAEFLGVETSAQKRLDALLNRAGVKRDERRQWLSKISKKKWDAGEAAVLSKIVDRAIEREYNRIRPLVFFVGATGLMPDGIDCVAMSAEDFERRHSVKLGKNQKEGTFFEIVNGVVISVFPENRWYTTEKGLKAIRTPAEE